MSYTPYNAPLLAGLLGDREIAGQFSVQLELQCMVQFELALAKAQGAEGVIRSEASEAIQAALPTFKPDLEKLGHGTTQDGIVPPQLVRQLREHVGNAYAKELHFGGTSQDVTDTSAMMRLRDCVAILSARLENLIADFAKLNDEQGSEQAMARTRMQRALPIPFSVRIAAWSSPLEHLLATRPVNFPLQLGGASGQLDKFLDKADAVRAAMAEDLQLTDPKGHWHTNRLPMIEIGNWLVAVSGALGKFGQDMVLMAQNEVAEVTFSGAGSSSAMPHKNNPVKAETLVTLARFNAGLIGALHQAQVHEYERSGAAWALEWMLMPQLAVAAGASLRNASELLASSSFKFST